MPAHYDALFRRLFENPEVSADFARNYLPADYQEKIDFESAFIDRDSYVDEVLRGNYTDLLYRFNKKEGGDRCTFICSTITNRHRTNGSPYSSCGI